MRHRKEIKEGIKYLEQLKKSVPKKSKFNDDNHQAIDQAIRVLEGNKTCVEDIFDMSLPVYDEILCVNAVHFLNGDIEMDDIF